MADVIIQQAQGSVFKALGIAAKIGNRDAYLDIYRRARAETPQPVYAHPRDYWYDKVNDANIDALESAIEAGQDAMVYTMIQQCGVRPHSNALTLAAAAGNMPLVRFMVSDPALKSAGLAVDPEYNREASKKNAFTRAAANGHVEIVEFLRSGGLSPPTAPHSRI